MVRGLMCGDEAQVSSSVLSLMRLVTRLKSLLKSPKSNEPQVSSSLLILILVSSSILLLERSSFHLPLN